MGPRENMVKYGSNGAPMGEIGENNLGDALDFSCICNNILWYFWGSIIPEWLIKVPGHIPIFF